MKNSLFLAEWKQIFSNKKILIPVIAVICVPILYAGMFLWAFWDPYAQLKDLPVAIVNQDKGAHYEGEDLDLGNKLIDKLKENDEFQFQFVSKKDGYKDLKNEKYYMLIEIPENFSENATTLLDDKPKKLQLKYVPNEGYNFLSAQIGETAMKEIKGAVSKEVTATYAETMFDKVKEMADGLGQASKGAGDLNDGANKLKDGSKALKDNLEVLASKSIDFNEGVNKVQSGTGDLAKGSGDLANGVNQLSDGSGKLLDASKDVQKGSQQLADGISQANKGLQEMDKKLPELVAGTSQVKNGVKQFQNELPSQMAKAIGGQIQNSAGQMNAGLDELQSQLSAQLSVGLADQMTNQQTAQLAQIFEAMKEANVNPEIIKAIQQKVKENSPTKDDLQKQLQQGIGAGINTGFTQYKSAVNKQLTGSTSQLEKQIKTAVDPTFNKLFNGLQTINNNQVKLQSGVHQLANGSKQLNGGALKLNEGQKQYIESLDFFNKKINEANAGANQLASGANQLNSGMKELSDGSVKISDGTHKLADGSKTLADGTVKVEDGTKELKDKLGDAAEEASSVHANSDTYDMMGEPVKVDKKGVNKVPNYGTGFAPYFLSLGLFVGALLISIVYKLKEPSIRPRNGFTWFMSKFGVIALVGVIQALLADAILLGGLGIEVKSVPLFIVTSIVISLTFMSLIQFFVTILGDPGRFIAIIILIMQLTTSAGTFPLELIPKALQPINAALPMTYTVQALKAVISSGDFSFMWHNIGILMAYIIGFAILTMVYFMYKHKSSQNTINEQTTAV
ncbi:hypothetical protein J6TS2_38380 [Heyndrickxia sporothermodurans]|nr:hypothetical protein J6TS2_38380 [Heyndrickxia sporothermodurans]